jgi:hypothetical protein
MVVAEGMGDEHCQASGAEKSHRRTGTTARRDYASHVEGWNRVPLDKGNGADNLSDERQNRMLWTGLELSRVLTHREISPRRPDCLSQSSANRSLKRDSLLTGKRTGNFVKIGPFGKKPPVRTQQNQLVAGQFPTK